MNQPSLKAQAVITGKASGALFESRTRCSIRRPTSNPTRTRESELYGIFCSAKSACTAVGYYWNGHHTNRSVAERWNGTRWSVRVPPERPSAKASNLNGVFCSSKDACVAVGAYWKKGPIGLTLAERWSSRRV